MSEDLNRRPTIETVLEHINKLGEKFDALSENLETQLDAFSERVNIRLDRIESMTNQTRAGMLTLRADFGEIRAHIKQTA
jgi:hypothetical protein